MKPFYAISFALTLGGLAGAQTPTTVNNGIVRLDPAFDTLVAKNAKLEKIATGFTFTEGPLWRPEGVLWFSDVPGNVVRSITPAKP